MNGWLLGALLLVVIGAAACDALDPIACTDELRPNVVVEVRDSMTSLPAAPGASGFIQDGSYTGELASSDTLHLIERDWGERAGHYTVTVRKPGYKDWSAAGIHVDRDACHVITARVRANLQFLRSVQLQPNPWRAPLDSLHVGGASVSVVGEGGRIVIRGWVESRATCESLFPFAHLEGQLLRIDILHPPAPGIPGGGCPSRQSWFAFEAGFDVPDGHRYRVVVTDRGSGSNTLAQVEVAVP